MPELPDITVYIEALERRILGRPVERIALRSAFVLRTVEPPITEAEGRTVAGLRRLGKRIVLDLGDGLFLAIHLMIAGRLRWLARGAKGPGRITLASFDFPGGGGGACRAPALSPSPSRWCAGGPPAGGRGGGRGRARPPPGFSAPPGGGRAPPGPAPTPP